MENSEEPISTKVIAYITSWCTDCTRSRRVLLRSSIPFVEIDIEKVSGAEEAMMAINGGSGKVPTIIILSKSGRRVLVEPGDQELTSALCDAISEN